MFSLTMNWKWIAISALTLTLLCSCQSADSAKAQSGSMITGVREVSVAQLRSWMAASQPLTLIDVREDDEWQAGHVPSARHISRFTLPEKIGTVAPDKSARVVLYCRSGKRSAASFLTLQRLGYTDVFSLAGGLQAYTQAGLPIQR
jgi:rhodanese-related sulfurtransferase